MSVTGSQDNFGTLAIPILAPGESETLSFEYAVTVQEDGFASSRTNTLCATFPTTVIDPFRCISPTGFELAAAGIGIGLFGRDQNPFIGVSGGATIELRVDGPAPTFKSQSGTVQVTVTNFDTLFTRSAAIQFAAYAIVDAVPEPETYALFIAGLGLLSWRGKRILAAPGETRVGRVNSRQPEPRAVR